MGIILVATGILAQEERSGEPIAYERQKDLPVEFDEALDAEVFNEDADLSPVGAVFVGCHGTDCLTKELVGELTKLIFQVHWLPAFLGIFGLRFSKSSGFFDHQLYHARLAELAGQQDEAEFEKEQEAAIKEAA